jgi:hypothetical protein
VVALFFKFREVLDLGVFYTMYFVPKLLQNPEGISVRVGKKIKMCRCACYKQNVVPPVLKD